MYSVNFIWGKIRDSICASPTFVPDGLAANSQTILKFNLPGKRKTEVVLILELAKKICSPTGNRTPGTTVRAWNVTNYTIEDGERRGEKMGI
jgi:hypothetical protein